MLIIVTREQLRSLDKHALIEIILEQGLVVMPQHTRINDLEGKLLAQEQRLTLLQERLAQNSKNSSKPPSSGCDQS